MGITGNFRIMRSVDGGDTWSKPAEIALDAGEYVMTPASALCAKENVYLAVMKKVAGKEKERASLVPVILRARQGADLTNRKAWTFSEPGKPFQEFAPPECLQHFGIQISTEPVSESPKKSERSGVRQTDGRSEWYAPHLMEIVDKNHFWHDPRGRTLHLFAELRTQRKNLAAVAKVICDDSGKMMLDTETAVGGMKTALISMPGGHLKFDIVYDETSQLYWLAGNPCFDTMTRSGPPPTTVSNCIFTTPGTWWTGALPHAWIPARRQKTGVISAVCPLAGTICTLSAAQVLRSPAPAATQIE